ncbi:MAG: hypothetical protein M0P13_09780 [Fibrobacteraceae bacterium]|nr:hypothetical protein [Fibrobacteraceae bacterium]
MKLVFAILLILLLEACSPKLYNADVVLTAQEKNTAKSPVSEFTATDNGDTVTLPANIKNAYNDALSSIVPDSCNLSILLEGSVRENYRSWWYLGIAVLAPLWPAMPRNTDMEIRLNANLVCNGIVAESVSLLEEEHTRLFWYGPYRTFELQKNANLLHLKLIQRLSQALSQNTATDYTIQSDF